MVTKEIFLKEMKELKKSSNKEIGELKKSFLREIDELKAGILIEMKEMRNEVAEIRKEMMEQKKGMEFINKCYEEMKSANEICLKKMDQIERENAKLKDENTQLRNDIGEMEERVQLLIHPLEIERRSCNLELHGLPEVPGEDCEVSSLKILRRVSPSVEIAAAFRIGNRKNQDGTQKNRPVLIKFKTKENRNFIYKNRINLKKVNDSSGRFFLNESLPPTLKSLFGKVNTIRKEKQYKFLWTNHGNILLKKDESSPVLVIKKLSDLNLIV